MTIYRLREPPVQTSLRHKAQINLRQFGHLSNLQHPAPFNNIDRQLPSSSKQQRFSDNGVYGSSAVIIC
jgi:hypothetical protein